jgi:hypothetical protein
MGNSNLVASSSRESDYQHCPTPVHLLARAFNLKSCSNDELINWLKQHFIKTGSINQLINNLRTPNRIVKEKGFEYQSDNVYLHVRFWNSENRTTFANICLLQDKSSARG